MACLLVLIGKEWVSVGSKYEEENRSIPSSSSEARYSTQTYYLVVKVVVDLLRRLIFSSVY